MEKAWESGPANHLDHDGFLLDDSVWSRNIAVELARIDTFGPLTDEHWAVIEYVRHYYLEHGQGPPVVKISKHTGLSSKRICTLFPCGVAKGCYRLAGLPRPCGC